MLSEALRDRVLAVSGATARNGDVACALNMVWSADRREALYLKSRVFMAAPAAGKLPIGGVWQQVHDLEGLRTACERDRALGMSGELVIHPSNVSIVNEVYSPSPSEVAYYKGMISGLDKAQAEGRASCVYDGEHIDIAHSPQAVCVDVGPQRGLQCVIGRQPAAFHSSAAAHHSTELVLRPH